MMTAADTIAPKATQKEWLGLAVLALPCMLYSMDLTVLNLAVPSLSRDLNPSAGQLLWIIDIYGFMVAGFLMVMGSLGDRFGRRLVLLAGAVAFGLASIFAAFAWSAEALIVARAVLGIAGATLAPSTLSLITTMFRDESERTFAISIWNLAFSAGATIGPAVGGLLIGFFWWGSVFLIGVPVMVLLLVLGPLLLPEWKDPQTRPLDIASALLSLVAVLAFVYCVKRWAEYGFDTIAAAAMAAGVGLAIAFLARQRRLAHPFVDLAFFRLPLFSLSLTVNMVSFFFMTGIFVLFAQYLQLVAGLSAIAAGLWSVPPAAAFGICTMFTARLTALFGAPRLMIAGMLWTAASLALLASARSVPAVVGALVLMSPGFTPLVTLTTTFVTGAVPPERAGIASAISETSYELGGALGIAGIGSVMTGIFRTRMAAAGTPEAGTTLAAAVEWSENLPADEKLVLLGAARGAFMEGFQASALLGAAAMAGLAILAWHVLAPARSRSASSTGT
jgi:DHA2 family multidrug resistance protein-like MFS transporter